MNDSPPGGYIKRCTVFGIMLFGGALFSVNAVDSNHDGMSDVWQQLYAVPGDAANQDDDLDGFTNLQESLLGSDPSDPNSGVRVQVSLDSENQVRLRIDTAFGKLYQLESSSDLAHWAALGNIITGTGDIVEFETPAPGSAQLIFYRGRFAGDIDNDGDGCGGARVTLHRLESVIEHPASNQWLERPLCWFQPSLN